ncbi:MAG: right-handed parallel beta-helix repeat-containing protein [Bacteroidota bacterium]
MKATTYYVSPQGNDQLSGSSEASAWQSLAKVNASLLLPGDRILLQGGESFDGGLDFRPSHCGTGQAPIVISSYGTGKAIIRAGRRAAISLYQCAGIEISHLILIGDGREANDHSGISVYTDQQKAERMSYLYFHHLDISGFNRGGITIYADEQKVDSAFSDIRITHVKAFENGDHGIGIRAKVLSQGYAMKDVHISHCEAHHNRGQLGKTDAHTGNGIVVGNTENVLIEFCTAYENGTENMYDQGGPVGIWMWDCFNGIIQQSEAHHNHTGSSKDGGGFDLDGGCQSCIIQYCYSHDNDGAGFLVAEYDGARPLLNNHIRFNISENDGKKNEYGALSLWCGQGILRDLYIYNNTFFLTADSPNISYACRTYSNGLDNVWVINNVFVSEGASRLLMIKERSEKMYFLNNAYQQTGSFLILHNKTAYSSLAAWRKASGQESREGIAWGLEGNMRLEKAGKGGTIGEPALLPTMKTYRSQKGSPLIGAGYDIPNLLNLEIGTYDFFQQPLSQVERMDIGAYQTMPLDLQAKTSDLDAGRRIQAEGNHLSISKRMDDGQKRNISLTKNMQGNWTLVTPFPLKKINALEVYDADGNKIQVLTLPQQSGHLLPLPQLDTLPRGIFFLKLFTTNDSWIQKFIH